MTDLKELQEKILNEGTAVNETVLKVDGFLNHQVDPVLMHKIGEDFANYLEEMDGCFAFIGGGDHPANHHGKFDFDEKALISGVRLMLTFVIV